MTSSSSSPAYRYFTLSLWIILAAGVVAALKMGREYRDNSHNIADILVDIQGEFARVDERMDLLSGHCQSLQEELEILHDRILLLEQNRPEPATAVSTPAPGASASDLFSDPRIRFFTDLSPAEQRRLRSFGARESDLLLFIHDHKVMRVRVTRDGSPSSDADVEALLAAEEVLEAAEEARVLMDTTIENALQSGNYLTAETLEEAHQLAQAEADGGTWPILEQEDGWAVIDIRPLLESAEYERNQYGIALARRRLNELGGQGLLMTVEKPKPTPDGEDGR